MVKKIVKKMTLIRAYLIGFFFIWLGFYILSFKEQTLFGTIIGWSNIIFWTGFLSYASLKLLFKRYNNFKDI